MFICIVLQVDHLTVGLRGANVIVEANAGGGILEIESQYVYNDGKWHFVKVHQSGDK